MGNLYNSGMTTTKTSVKTPSEGFIKIKLNLKLRLERLSVSRWVINKKMYDNNKK